MPDGVEVLVADGVAEIDFVDKSKRGPALAKLFEVGTPPEQVTKVTRPRVLYSVPVEYARKAGLIDGSEPAEGPSAPKGYDDGKPDMDWSRKAINEYAAGLKPPLDTTGEKNKEDALDAIKNHKPEPSSP